MGHIKRSCGPSDSSSCTQDSYLILILGFGAHLCERGGESINFPRGKLTLRPFLKGRVRNPLYAIMAKESSVAKQYNQPKETRGGRECSLAMMFG